MEGFWRLTPARVPRTRAIGVALPYVDRITKMLAPGRVRDFREDRLDRFSVVCEAVVETDRIEGQPEIARSGQEANRAAGRAPEFAHEMMPDAIGERRLGGAEVIPAPELDRGASVDRPQPAACKDGVFFIEVEVEQVDRVAEAELDRLETSMSHHAFVQAAAERHSGPPSVGHRSAWVGPGRSGTARAALPRSTSRQAWRAEITPSSWKPYRQYAPA